MAGYLTTNGVSVFPTSYRKEDTGGKYTSEQNFVNILNSIVDHKDYVIGVTKNDDQKNVLEFVIHGYYFRVLESELSDLGNNFYFNIEVEKGSVASDALVAYTTSSTIDKNMDTADGKFRGLYYDTVDHSAESTEYYNIYSLKISRTPGTSGYTYDTIFKFDSSKLMYDGNDISAGTRLNGKSVTEVLDLKQNELVAGDGIAIDESTNTLSLTSEQAERLHSLDNGLGSSTKFIYFDKNNNEFKETDASIGHRYTVDNSYITSQNVFINEGNIAEGVKFFASKNSPQQQYGSNGDFWFKYSD